MHQSLSSFASFRLSHGLTLPVSVQLTDSGVAFIKRGSEIVQKRRFADEIADSTGIDTCFARFPDLDATAACLVVASKHALKVLPAEGSNHALAAIKGVVRVLPLRDGVLVVVADENDKNRRTLAIVGHPLNEQQRVREIEAESDVEIVFVFPATLGLAVGKSSANGRWGVYGIRYYYS